VPAANPFAKGEFTMRLPKTVSVWFMVPFFLFAGLGCFGVSLGVAGWVYLAGIFALGAVVFLFLGKKVNPWYTTVSPFSRGDCFYE
jgi:hypothetical protein